MQVTWHQASEASSNQLKIEIAGVSEVMFTDKQNTHQTIARLKPLSWFIQSRIVREGKSR